ncbi:nucleotide exchange factor GrpE [Pseudomonadales bacterium]|nr:nucleotide exchange factor GrpE [Pseudomonadales bacterium]
MTNSNETAPDRSEGQAEIEASETQNHDESAPQDVEALSTGEGVLDSLADAQAEAEKFRDLALRSEAEMQNLRKRAERDVQNAHKFGVERLIQNLLPVLDSLEKAIETSLQAETPEDDPQLEGLKLCFKLFTEVFEKEGVQMLDPLGQAFDPNVHEALSMIENPDMEPNSVMAVIQKGYRLHERLVRPAMVIVSKPPAGA